MSNHRTTITLPPVFWNDHVRRDCLADPTTPVRKLKSGKVVVELIDEDIADLLSDAEHYADEIEYGLGMVSSAKATVKAILRTVDADTIARCRAALRSADEARHAAWDAEQKATADAVHAAADVSFDGRAYIINGVRYAKRHEADSVLASLVGLDYMKTSSFLTALDTQFGASPAGKALRQLKAEVRKEFADACPTGGYNHGHAGENQPCISCGYVPSMYVRALDARLA